MMRLPAHLKRYVVTQDYERYTPVDQAVWRYIMRQLASYLAKNAHPCYLEGLRKSGIEIDTIPDLAKMSVKLERFGWNVVPVSGFIPPAAFMELQAHGFLPVASDLRTIDHLLYTPAPDIVHEAAGHAPILIEPEFAEYLKSYAQVASKAIISHEDMAQYEAIRVLSDLKEDPSSTEDQIDAAEERLTEVNSSISHISEAALLGRMNWWTAEYGLVGSLDTPRIYGAGLLSSIEESRHCLSRAVKKIPLTVDCIDYAYDITEMQPQLFVTPDFAHLSVVLDELADRMAFRLGGVAGLEKARQAQTVNSVVFETGLQISGRLKSFSDSYLQFDGPCQLSVDGKELEGHSVRHHAAGYGTPYGLLSGADRPLSAMSDADFPIGVRSTLKFSSGVFVDGVVRSLTRHPSTGALLLVSWDDCRVTDGSRLLFDPAWGVFDMGVGQQVVSVFGGPADRLAYGETDDFVAKVIPRKPVSPLMLYKHELYQAVRDMRERLIAGSLTRDAATSSTLEKLFSRVEGDLAHDWLIRLEILELAQLLPSDDWRPRLELQLRNLSEADANIADRIAEGVQVFGQTFLMNRLHVVLHRPIYPRNIGMCARAIGNMGAGRLIIVGRTEPLGNEAKQGAAHAQEILSSATLYATLEDFYTHEPDGVRIALSGKDARLKAPDLLPELLKTELARDDHRLRNVSVPVYLFFGTEDDGLSAEEMDLCHFICRLPTFTEINSLNLSHAVLLTLYIVRTAMKDVAPVVVPDAGDVRYPQRLIREWLEQLGFSLESPRINIEKTLNRILLGRAPTTDELRTLNNILQQTVRKLRTKSNL